MKKALSLSALVLAATPGLRAEPTSADIALTQPRVGPEVVFEEREGVVAVEVESFYKQTLTDKRAFYVVTAPLQPKVTPDPDGPHLEGASGGAYVEILPDTRATNTDPLVNGTNFSNTPGVMATLHYRVHFHTPGRYYVWCRTFSSLPALRPS